MFPAAFEYVRANSLKEALAALKEHGGDARVLAGGQSLIPAMRYRLAQPAVLVDINPIDGLSYIKEDGGVLKIGALTRHSDLEFSNARHTVRVGTTKHYFCSVGCKRAFVSAKVKT